MRMLLLMVSLLFMARGAVAQVTLPKPDVGIDPRLNESVPLDLSFRNEQGDAVTLGNYFGGRPVVLVLAYYRCPRLCNLSLNNLAASLSRLDYQAGRDFAVVIVSIDPRETPELAAAKKAALVERYVPPGGESGWHLLTGDEPAIQRLASAVGFRFEDDARRDLYAHVSGILILTPDGKVARYFFGIDYAPRDLRFGLEDASNGNIGLPIAQPLRMLCFAYDPEAGTYTLMTLRLVQFGGAITVVILGIFLLRAWRREPQTAWRS